MKPEQVSNDVLEFLKNKYGDEINIESLRLGLGLTVSAIHATLIHSAKTDDERQGAVHTAMDTVERMIGSIQKDCEICGMPGIEFVKGIVDENGNMVETKQGENDEGRVH